MTVKRDMLLSGPGYRARTIVSPNQFGEEQKDQDRARVFEPGLVGIVCDGVTSSPRSRQGAELVTSFAPILFEGDAHERLRTVCDLLMGYREEFQKEPLAVPDDTPAAVQTMLRDILREKQATSYQTTIVAVRLRPAKSGISVEMLRCGDSAIFAFSGDGELLYSSLDQAPQTQAAGHHTFLPDQWRFGPGDQILVRVEGKLADHRTLAETCGVQERHWGNWLICTAIDACPDDKKDRPGRPDGMVIARGDKLLVPRYLYGRALTSEGQKHRYLDYSSTIRMVAPVAPRVVADALDHRGSVTTVLPDHFYSGHCDFIEDRFPCGTHFVLGSDGFYSAFATASQMWAWLQENRNALAVPQEQAPKLRELHQQLHEKSSDDDMACVWMYPVPAGTAASAGVTTEQEE